MDDSANSIQVQTNRIDEAITPNPSIINLTRDDIRGPWDN